MSNPQVPVPSDVRAIPLHQRFPSPLNVRKTGCIRLDGLAASIEARGIIHNLTVTCARAKPGGPVLMWWPANAGSPRCGLKLLPAPAVSMAQTITARGVVARRRQNLTATRASDRESGVEGTGGSVRVDLGGRRFLRK